MRAERNKKEADRAREHDFEVIDSAVTGTATAEPEDAALTSFALAVKSAKPEPEAGFVRELDERIEQLCRAGAPEDQRTSIWRPRRAQLITVGCVAIVLGATVTIAGLSQGGDESMPQQAAGQSSTGDQAIGPSKLSEEPSAEALQAGPREVVRDATVRIGTGSEEFTQTTDEIIAITDRMGGYVLNSSVGDGTQSASAAQLSLMIPEPRFQEALAEISALGTVLERNQSAEDVTASVTRVDRRVSSLRARRADLVERLKSASTDQERSAIRAQLRRTNARLRDAVNEQRSVQRKVRYSSISAAVTPTAEGDEKSAVASAWETSKSVLEMIIAGAIVFLAIGIPLGFLALALVIGAQLWRRRTRDRAVDSADSADSAPTQVP